MLYETKAVETGKVSVKTLQPRSDSRKINASIFVAPGMQKIREAVRGKCDICISLPLCPLFASIVGDTILSHKCDRGIPLPPGPLFGRHFGNPLLLQK
jgi:hypothetical protein